MPLTINGEEREYPADVTLPQIIAAHGMNPRYVAVEINLRVVPRAEHATCQLQPGDRIELVTLVGGG
ncbi:MAG: sulfur carrier protein ThiS [Pirellulales bacterium]|nr:sulfur carrier protein ThiS [Pirellulales bacterium]